MRAAILVVGIVAFLVTVVVLLIGCGSPQTEKWTPLDTTTTTDLSSASLALEEVCARTDAGQCQAAFVRSVELDKYCAANAMLSRHAQPWPDAGVVPVNCDRGGAK
jgi:hypothetical protein